MAAAEYLVEVFRFAVWSDPGTAANMSTRLNELGAEGWQVIGSPVGMRGDCLVYTLTREKTGESWALHDGQQTTEAG